MLWIQQLSVRYFVSFYFLGSGPVLYYGEKFCPHVCVYVQMSVSQVLGAFYQALRPSKSSQTL